MDDGGDVYELAQNPSESSDPSQAQMSSSKPAPKPRPSTRHHNTKDPTSGSSKAAQLSKASSQDDADFEPRIDSTVEDPSSKRRPSRRCVEIEYEIASEIRATRQDAGPSASQSSSTSPFSMPNSHNDHSKDNSSIATAVSPAVRKTSIPQQHAGNTQVIPVSAPLKGRQSSKRDVYSMGQPVPGVQPESMYEEPWDLKVRRLKQEEERASQVIANKSDFPTGTHAGLSEDPFAVKTEAVYQDAWDTAAQQRKLEAKLNFARSLSTTSETSEIFHDALDNIPQAKVSRKVINILRFSS